MSIFQQLQRSLIEPSSEITGSDQRRLASLLSGFLLGIILIAVVAEVVTVILIEQEHYVGYRTTLAVLLFFAVIYGISRTRYVQIAAVLTVVVSSAGVLFAGWADPAGVRQGLFDFVIIPIWLGSLYLNMRQLVWLIAANLVGFLVFPLLVPEVSIRFIVVGPFSFVILTSFVLVIVSWYRNLLELDRRTELAEKERRSRREAARAAALLRVAERLNAQLDLDTLLNAICEEVTLALHTPVSLVTLYDEKQAVFRPAAAAGIQQDEIGGMAPFPRTLYDQTVAAFGTCFGLPDLQDYPQLPNVELFRQLDLRALGFASMKYEHQVIGTLTAVTQRDRRYFSEDELLLLQGLADQAALAIVNTKLFKDAHRRLERLQALRTIDLAIASNRDLRDTLDVVLQQITGQLAVDAAVILLMDDASQELEFGASRGFHTPTFRFTRLRLGEGIAGRAAQQNKIVHIHDLQTDPQTLVYAPSLAREGFISYYAAPLIAQDKVKGVLEIFHRSMLDPDAEWMGFLEALAGQAAIAIENTTLLEDLQRTNAELSEAYDTTIEGWSHALDLRDKETEGHTLRVAELTLELALVFGFSAAEMVHIRRGALLHDIGKMGVPDRILLKEDKLTEEEWEVMRKHPVFAHEMLVPISYLRPALDIPYCHHERWDGTGYPRGLKGEEIPLTARIFAVADVWDALTSHRPYRTAWTPERTLAYIRDGAGKQFDPKVVEAFVGLLTHKSPE